MMPSRVRTLVKSYFESLQQHKVAAAERTLNNVQRTIHSTPWQKGYVNALEGMLVALKTKKDERLLITTIDSQRITQLLTEFIQQSGNELLMKFDRGFFAAWVDYLRCMRRRTQAKIDAFTVNPVVM